MFDQLRQYLYCLHMIEGEQNNKDIVPSICTTRSIKGGYQKLQLAQPSRTRFSIEFDILNSSASSSCHIRQQCFNHETSFLGFTEALLTAIVIAAPMLPKCI